MPAASRLPRVARALALAAVSLFAAASSGLAGAAEAPTATAPASSSQSASSSRSASSSAAPLAFPATTAATATTLPPVPRPAPLQWRGCPNRPQFRCATLPVPLDYARPTGPTIDVALLKVPARRPSRRIGSLVVNPGGPGVSGVTFARQAAAGLLGTRLLDRFDIVGFDPRGVGGSAPVRCADAAGLDRFLSADPDPDTLQERAILVAESKALAEGCATRNPASLGRIGTVDAARDLEQLRIALGDEGLSYLGFSYGTLLGGVYAELYPARIRALALDGILDPAATLEDRTREQAQGFERMLTEYLADCDRSRCPYAANGTARAGLDALLARLETAPLTVPAGAVKKGARRVGPAEATTAILSALYSPKLGWPRLTAALGAAAKGDGAGLLRLFDNYVDRNADGTYLNTNDANLAINCLDVASPRDVGGFDALATRAVAVSPHFGRAAAYYSLPCAYWRVPVVGLPEVRAAGAPPILLVGNIGDPATPYTWAQRVAARMPSAVLLTNRASGHTAYVSGGRCVRDAVEDYLVSRTVPKQGAVCPSP